MAITTKQPAELSEREKDHIADQWGREIGVLAAAHGGQFTSLQAAQWARAHPDSALHWLLNFRPGVTDEDQAAEFDRLYNGKREARS